MNISGECKETVFIMASEAAISFLLFRAKTSEGDALPEQK